MILRLSFPILLFAFLLTGCSDGSGNSSGTLEGIKAPLSEAQIERLVAAVGDDSGFSCPGGCCEQLRAGLPERIDFPRSESAALYYNRIADRVIELDAEGIRPHEYGEEVSSELDELVAEALSRPLFDPTEIAWDKFFHAYTWLARLTPEGQDRVVLFAHYTAMCEFAFWQVESGQSDDFAHWPPLLHAHLVGR